MRYIQGIDRDQMTLLPEVLDDYISKENPVLFIDAYIDSLDPVRFGFTHSEPKEKGRMPYNPADLLKLYVYGYLNRIRSSRRLDKATYQNIELMWLLRRLHPDFKTIADFRKDNLQPIKKVCRDFTLLCKKLNLFGCELIAIDGSKFSAVNHNHRCFTKKKLMEILKAIDARINSYLNELDRTDLIESDVKDPSKEHLKAEIDELRARRKKYENVKEQIDKSGKSQISLTDPDSRMMKDSSGTDVGYNLQIVTDSKHKLIVDHKVTNEATDDGQLFDMAIKAKEILDVDRLEAIADAGYYSRDDIMKCGDERITCYVPTYNSSKNKKAGLYTKDDFYYNQDKDCYTCPAKQNLAHHHDTKHQGKEVKVYRTQACSSCFLKANCTRAQNGRVIRRWVHEKVIDDMEERALTIPVKMDMRKSLVEHPLGTIKHWMVHDYFLMRGFEKVSAEMSLSVLCYNLKRVLNIVDFKKLMAVIA